MKTDLMNSMLVLWDGIHALIESQNFLQKLIHEGFNIEHKYLPLFKKVGKIETLVLHFSEAQVPVIVLIGMVKVVLIMTHKTIKDNCLLTNLLL